MMVRLSPGNMKLGKLTNISLTPVVSCQKGVPCSKKDCYALKAYRMYKNVRECWDSNYRYYLQDNEGFFNNIIEQLNKKKPERFRWHVAGDIVDQEYFNGMVRVAETLPDTSFLCYTKKYELDFSNAPRNLRIVISAWPGLEIPKKLYSMPIAWLSEDTRRPEERQHRICNDDCPDCGYLCYEAGSKFDVVFDKH